MASLRLASPGLRCTGPSRVARTQVRYANDLIVQQRSDSSQRPQPIVKQGPFYGGRSATSGHVVTVFGPTGFLGRYTVSKIAKAGSQVVVPYRDEDAKRPLRVMGDLGQIVPVEFDARNAQQIYEAVKHSDIVYNLVGRDWETRNYKYTDTNVKIPELIAKVSADAGVSRFVHVSHLNASPDSESAFYRTKYEGEVAVREVFPEATIVRPSQMFGAEDWLLNDLAQWPIKYKLNEGKTKVMPVHVLDVAEALNVILNAPVTSTASTFALPGPEAYTYDELLNLVEFFTLRKIPNYPTIPRPLIMALAKVLNRAIWWPTINPDEIVRKYIDDSTAAAHLFRAESDKPDGWNYDVAPAGQVGVNGEPVKSWADLDIVPDLLEEHAVKYLRRYRTSEGYDVPLESARFKPTKRYHVVP